MIRPEQAFSLAGHTCLITGSTRGIGRGLAESIAAAGADVAIVGTRLEDARQVAQEIHKLTGRKTLGLQCDVRDSAQVDAMFKECQEQLGTPDLLLNNAGISILKETVKMTDAEWKDVLDVNLNGPFYCCRAFAHLLEQEGKHKGAVVNLVSNSHAVVTGPVREAAYNASKAGLLMLTKTLAIEWVGRGIRVNSISPGYIYTDMVNTADPAWVEGWNKMIPVGRMGTPDELAGAVIYLFSNYSTFTVGCDMLIDGGYTCI